ncbi:uncharacterized protein [Rutidosis leptorrhynchoides]|uniref:uncharacterized protein n=1 Tax=Rutidosis leptorrhynchoides TaxID=125765 RepID=UPI003A997DFA
MLRWGVTKYFHNSLKRKYNKNNIRGINVNGSWCENPNTIKEVAFNHFKSIFEVHNSDGPSLEGLFSESITSADNELLEAPFTEEEIWESVKCCGSSKAPGPDGFNFGFFKKFLSIIKDDLVGAINWFWVFAEGLNILTKVAVERGMYKGVEVGKDKVVIFHLQYADDTIFFGEWSRLNARNLIYLLECFERASGLKVNYNKSQLFGIGISNDNVEALASWCSCLGGRLPFMYLGIPVGNRMKKLNDWSPVIEKFNKSIYGSNGGLVLGNGLARNPNASIWNSICDAGKHVDGLGISFSNSFIRSIGDGKNTSLWDDIWVGNASFKDRFKRLHWLEIDKDINISSKFEEFKGDGLDNWAYPSMGRTNSELNELRDTVRNLQLNEGKKDCWSWNLNSKGIYTVKDCSVLVDKVILPRAVNSIESLRNGLVPKKVEVFIWRARLGRIPVKFELDKRGIDLNSVRCPICDGDIETVEHILFSCQVAKDIWAKVLKWWGYNSAIFGFEDIFNGTFGCVAQDHKKNQWQAVCWVVCYILWKNRNAKVFKNKLETVPSLFSEVQVLSYDWISRRCKGHIMDWLQWFSHP